MAMLKLNDDYNSGWALAGVVVFALIGNGALMVGPIAVGAMVDELAFSESQAGFVFTAEYFGLALGCLLTAFRINLWNRRSIALSGLVIFIIGNVSACFATNYPAMLAIRLFEGLGAGLANAAFFATAAGMRDPDRTFGFAFAGTLLYAGLAVLLSPYLINAAGINGLFVFLAAFGVLALPAVGWIPGHVDRTAVPLVLGRSFGAHAMSLGAALCTMFLLFGGHAGIWAYQERLGVSQGLDRGTISLIISASTLIGFLASMLAAWTGLRLGRAIPPSIAFATAAAGSLLVLYGGTLSTYLAGSLLILVWFYGLPYVMGIISRLDPHGRAATFSFFIAPVGGTIGPLLAASLIGNLGYVGVFWTGAAAFLLCIILIVPVALRIDRLNKSVR